MAVPVKVESSPSTSNGLASGLSHSGGLRGATAVCCSAIEDLLSRECPAREVSCASADAGHPGAHRAEDLVGDGVAPGGHLLCGDARFSLLAQEHGLAADGHAGGHVGDIH